jgi:p-aminobenzoyl-glutamate transporter AbgT
MMTPEEKQDIDNLKKSMARIEEALLGNEEYKREGVISIVKRHDELFIKMSHMGRFTVALLGVGIASGSALTWFFHHIHEIADFFKK